MIELYFYSTNATGWTLCFRTKDIDSIRVAYQELKRKRNKEKNKVTELAAGKMLSEHFRFFLSTYVKRSNFRHKRHGVRVHSKMEKYIFSSKSSLDDEISKMKAMRERKLQRAKYRPNMAYYLVEKQLNRDSIWRNSLVGLGGQKLIKLVLPCYNNIRDEVYLLRELIKHTWKLHFGSENNPFPPPLLE